jgi:acyl carrier protein
MTTLLDTEVLARLRHCLPRLAPAMQEDIPLRALALDSMDTVELLCAVDDEFGVRLTQDEFQPHLCLRDVAQSIAHRSFRTKCKTV